MKKILMIAGAVALMCAGCVKENDDLTGNSGYKGVNLLKTGSALQEEPLTDEEP